MLVRLNEEQLRKVIYCVLDSLLMKEEVMKENDIMGKFLNRGILCEGLITSYPINSVRNIILNMEIGKYDIKITKMPFFLYKNRKDETSYQIFLSFSNGCEEIPKEYIEDLEARINACGWYVSATFISGKRYRGLAIDDALEEGTAFYCVVEPKFDVILSAEELPQKLYHITSKKIVKKILKNGIVPKSSYGDIYYPERVYMFIEKPNNLDAFGNKEEQCILEIDTEALNKTNNVYIDPNSNVYKACFTMEPIPPFAIRVIEN